MTTQEARERDRQRRFTVEKDRRMILTQRPTDAQAILPYNELRNGGVVLDEASEEFRERLTAIQAKRRKQPGRMISARGNL